MTARDRLIVKFVVPLVAVVAFWFLALSPRLHDLRKAGDDVTTARAALGDAQAKLASQQDDSAQLRRQRSLSATAQLAVPRTAGTPALLRQLQRTAERSGVQLQSVTPGGAASVAAPTPDLAATTLGLTFSGTYASSQRFLRDLGRLVRVSGSRVTATGRLLSLGSVALSQGEGGGKLTGTVSASVYTLAPAAQQATGATTPQSSTGATTASGTSATSGSS
jgi:Tfp pilus assembly protein PilO